MPTPTRELNTTCAYTRSSGKKRSQRKNSKSAATPATRPKHKVITRAIKQLNRHELVGHCQRWLRWSPGQRAEMLLMKDRSAVVAHAYYAQIDEAELESSVAAAKKMAKETVHKAALRKDNQADMHRRLNALTHEIKVTSADLQRPADPRMAAQTFLLSKEYRDGHPCSAPHTLFAPMTAKDSPAAIAKGKERVLAYMPKGPPLPGVPWGWRKVVPFDVVPCRGQHCSCGGASQCPGFVCVAPHPDDGFICFAGAWTRTKGVALPFLPATPLVYRMPEDYNHEERELNRAARRALFPQQHQEQV